MEATQRFDFAPSLMMDKKKRPTEVRRKKSWQDFHVGWCPQSSEGRCPILAMLLGSSSETRARVQDCLRRPPPSAKSLTYQQPHCFKFGSIVTYLPFHIYLPFHSLSSSTSQAALHTLHTLPYINPTLKNSIHSYTHSLTHPLIHPLPNNKANGTPAHPFLPTPRPHPLLLPPPSRNPAHEGKNLLAHRRRLLR